MLCSRQTNEEKNSENYKKQRTLVKLNLVYNNNYSLMNLYFDKPF